MPKVNIQVNCESCAAPRAHISNANAQRLKRRCAILPQPKVYCPCGCVMELRDDGVPVEDGGSVECFNASPPRIDSLPSAVSGPVGGGTTVRVNGKFFAHSVPTVYFNGVAGVALNVLNDGALDVNTPAGSVRLLSSMQTQLDFTNEAAGPFTVGETVTGGVSGVSATVREVGADYLMVSDVSGVFALEAITGASSGASADVTAVSTPAFQLNETLQGQTSGGTVKVVEAGATPRVNTPLIASLIAGEQVVGLVSGARATLSPVVYDGAVDVEIENEFGRRQPGAVLSSAFEFTL